MLTFTGNTIKGFALGDAIDLSGATFSSAANPPTLGAGNLLQFTENGTTYKVQFESNPDVFDWVPTWQVTVAAGPR